jgi:hypothetical protein
MELILGDRSKLNAIVTTGYGFKHFRYLMTEAAPALEALYK